MGYKLERRHSYVFCWNGGLSEYRENIAFAIILLYNIAKNDKEKLYGKSSVDLFIQIEEDCE